MNGDVVFPRLSLRLELDQDAYMEGDPVYALVCVSNQDTVGFRDLADMEPTGHFLGLDIQSGVRQLRRRIDSEIGYSLEGLELEPGGCACEVVKVSYVYGQSQDGWGQGRLPPGQYRVMAHFAARLGFFGLSQVWVRSDTVTFRVVPRTVPAGNVTLDSLLQVTEERLSTARVLEIAQSTRRDHLGPHDPDVAAAVQVNHRIRARRIGDAEKRKWIAELKAKAESDDVRCVLDTMDRKISQKRFYWSYGP